MSVEKQNHQQVVINEEPKSKEEQKEIITSSIPSDGSQPCIIADTRPTTNPESVPMSNSTRGIQLGLECLTQIEKLLIRQKVQSRYESGNEYEVMNTVGQKVFKATEKSSCLQTWFCGNLREFNMKIFDQFDKEVIHIYRPLACQDFIFPCWLQKMDVFSPPGTFIGSIEQQWSIYPEFKVTNPARETLLFMKGPFCPVSCGSNVFFRVFDKDGETEVGTISKQWSGLLQEVFTDTDTFEISFPMNFNVELKAVLLGACFLMDFLFFELGQNFDRRLQLL